MKTKRALRAVVTAMLTAISVVIVPAALSASQATATTPGCGFAPTNGSTSANGTVTRILGTRTYELHVPAGLVGPSVPLLIELHGAGSDGYEDEASTGWSQYVDAHNAIVAYPDATGSGSGVWDPYTANSPDVTFVRQVVADISANWCVDSKRVFVDGWSNGAVMSERVACDAADLFAAGTSYAGGDPTVAGTACTPSRPIAYGVLAGTFDFTYATLAQNAQQWASWDKCGAGTTPETDAYGSGITWTNCPAGIQVWQHSVNTTSHNWPTGAQGDDQRDRMWAFYMANPHP